MMYPLPNLGKPAIAFGHFPTRFQAFIFRAYEYVQAEKIAEILGTTVEKVIASAREMGLSEACSDDTWLSRGYITIIRRMWHILPYEQLLKLVGMDEQEFALRLKEEDFLGKKLGDKPLCEPVAWCELTEEERAKTAKLKAVMDSIDISGVRPFDFKYEIPKINHDGKEVFSTRMIYAFSGLYQHAFDVDSESYLPDAQLEAYRNLGINGIWMQGVLTELAPFPFEPSISKGYQNRLAGLKRLCERLSHYGIKLYLYINEPRFMPLSFFENHYEIKGHIRGDGASLCTSTEAVRTYLADSIESICRAVPELGGFFTITRSENLTNCYSHSGDNDIDCLCPRCRERSIAEVVSEVINTIAEGAHRVSPDIKVFAWGWAWRKNSTDIIRRLSKDVILLWQSEVDVPFEIGGVKGTVIDYSMSISGPGEVAKSEWATARECGLEIGAKVQINTTWEASTVPAIPISPSINKHIRALRDEGVEHLLLSWTLGGYPCRNIAAAAKYFYKKCEFDEKDSPSYAAEEQFARAFSEFPFHITTLYYGPQNAGPSTLLFPTATGYRATMTCFAYDDLEKWRSIYPIDIFESQFDKLCTSWEKGLALLPEDDESEVAVMARAAYCLFKSSLNQIRFIRARNECRWLDAACLCEEEEKIARLMLEQMNKNAAIGYEAANHYYFSKGQLAEKIVNCHYVREVFINKYNEK